MTIAPVYELLILVAALTAEPTPTRWGTPTADVRAFRGYVASYDGRLKYNRWTLARLDKKQLRARVERNLSFLVDEGVPEETQSGAADFEDTGYHRGHLEPANDHRASTEDAREVALYSNMSPQLPAFNQGVWKRLEAAIHTYAQRDDVRELYVVTIPLFVAKGDRVSYPVIGPGKLPVPTHFAKSVLVVYADGKIRIASFVVPHKEFDDVHLRKFAVSTDELEGLAGYDLWSKVDDQLEKRMEAEVPTTE